MEVTNFFEYADAVVLLNKWGDAYSTGNTLVSDAEYDVLYKKILQFEKMYPDMANKNSPTRKVHSDSADGFIKTDHKYPMLSIANSNGYAELEDWLNSTWNKGVREFVIEFKIDGLALSLPYENGKLVDAVTRGNGSTGDSVISNVLEIKSIPKDIGNFTGEIRGEVVWFLDRFEHFQKVLESEGKERMANPRNGAAGSLKQKDPSEVKRRNLDFVAYSVVAGSKRPKQSDDLIGLKSHGFYISDHHICKSVKEVMAAAHKMEAMREKLPFLTDGLVIKTNDKDIYSDLGGSSKTPHYLTALKFPPEEKETEVVEIEHSYGRSGAVTPVCIVKPTQLAGTTVQRASLHNWDILEYLGLHKGCKVVIRKSGEIIPEIISVVGIGRTKTDYENLINKVDRKTLVESMDELKIKFKTKEFIIRPTHCVHCKTKLAHGKNRSGNDLVVLECPNQLCTVKQFKNIVRFVSKEAMNIFGVDESIIEKLLSAGLIKNYTDLYSLKKQQVMTIEGFAERSAEKVIDAINASRNNNLNQLLVGFGISNVGRTLSDKLATEFDTLDKFSNITAKDLTSMQDVGPETISCIMDWLSLNKSTIKFFIDNNIGCKAKAGIKILSNKLNGKTLIMSGTSDNLEREQFKVLVKQNGGSIVSGVSKKLDYFVQGEAAGPEKLNKISDLIKSGVKIKVISPEDFLELIK